MAFPTTGLLDDFNRANTGPPPSASWTADPFLFGQAAGRVVSNQCVPTSGSTPICQYWNAATFTDSEVYMTLTGTLTGASLGVRLTQPATVNWDGYLGEYVDSLTRYRIYEVTNNTYTQLGASITGTNLGVGHKLGLEVIGTTIQIYSNTGGGWTSEGSRTDSAHAGAGNVGVQSDAASEANNILDDVGGGTVVVSAASPFRAWWQFVGPRRRPRGPERRI